MFYNFDRDSNEHTLWDMHNRRIGDIIRFRVENTWFKLTKEGYTDTINITTEVKNWLKDNNITYPFNKENEMLFRLRFE